LSPLTAAPSRHRGVDRDTLPGHPFSRSYGVNLPSSLTEDRSSTWGYLPPPTSVGLRYGPCACIKRLEAFLGGRPTTSLPPAQRRLAPWLTVHGIRICLDPLLPRATDPVQLGRLTLATASPPRLMRTGAGLSTCWPSPTPPSRRPRLRTRLTLGRLPLPRNPEACGVGGSHTQLIRYSFRHSRFGSLQQGSRSAFSATPERSPTTWPSPRRPHSRLRSAA
jgi:hypothetical protein